jgi:hypothetical protein
MFNTGSVPVFIDIFNKNTHTIVVHVYVGITFKRTFLISQAAYTFVCGSNTHIRQKMAAQIFSSFGSTKGNIFQCSSHPG